jgi:pyruvate kinase
VYGLTRNVQTERFMTLYRGVYPIHFDPTVVSSAELYLAAIGELKRRHVVTSGDWVIVTRGDALGILGGTNTMKILQVDGIVS